MRRREFLALLPAAPAALAQGPVKPRLRRADAFFGLHFDLHPNASDTILGRDVTDEMVGRLLDRVRPDYVQYDCKGHPGWLGYPSQVSRSAKMVRDSLEVWRRHTAQRGIGLFIHFSGVWDSLAVEEHPDWARVGPDGKLDKEQTSTFGPYVDERMIPQLREVATKYSLDGAWVDGECWATKPDYSERAAKAWGRAMPKKPGDPEWQEFLEFHREQFRKYATHYINELHRTHPQFQIASNWLYTTYVPERPSVPVDFLSGDYLGNAAISAARLDARYLASVGLPWDLMAWGFQWGRNNALGNVWKPAVQLQQEASVVLAQGGGFQPYYSPPRGGHFDDTLVDAMSRVAGFCRKRQALCHKSESVPQAGIVFSKRALYRTTNRLFGGWGSAVNPARGMLDALLELHYSVDVVPDWKLDEVAARYPLLVLPDWADAGQEVHDILRRYVEAGGKLLIAGAASTRLFGSELGLKLLGEAAEAQVWVKGGALLGNVKGLWQAVEPAGAEVLEHRYEDPDSRSSAGPAATLARYGKGAIAAMPGPMGADYALTHDPSVREFIGRVAGRLWAGDLKLSAPPTVEAALRRNSGATVLHLINVTGMQVASDYSVIDHVPPVGPIGVALRLPKQPRSVRVEPGGAVLSGKWTGGYWMGNLDRLDIHSMVVFEE